jgi:hypothetical protein
LGKALVRTARVTPAIDWTISDGPWFGNEMASLKFLNRSAQFRIDRAVVFADAGVRLEVVGSRTLS